MQNDANPGVATPLKEVDSNWGKCLGFSAVSNTAESSTVQTSPQSRGK